MSWYHWVLVFSASFFLIWLVFNLFRLVQRGLPEDFSIPAGNVKKGIRYSFTGALNPVKKESAYLHLPTYIAGICYHTGTFLSFGLIPVMILRIILPPYLLIIIGSGILISIGCGTGILIKRIVTGKLRHLSSPDDYLSNLLVTLFQIVTLVVIIKGSLFPSYFIFLSLLLLYIPVGKLKHLLYFFAARTQLGNFYGRRGVWPPVNNYKK